MTYPAIPSGQTWIYGSAHIGVPGHRQIKLGGVTYTITPPPSQPLDFWDLLDEVDGAVAGAGWSLDVTGSSWSLSGPSAAALEWPDRLGALLGFDAEPGDVEPLAAAYSPRAVSLACIPLESCERVQITREQERRLDVTRFGRGHGYSFGAADLWSLRVVVAREAFHALRSRWCVSGGPVVVSSYTLAQHLAGSAVAFDADHPTGYLRGRAIGVDGGWPDASGPHRWFEFDLVMAVEVT